MARKLIETNYNLNKAYKYAMFTLSHLENKQTVVIYQMGKVGSSSVLRSLKALDLNIYCYHVHALNPEEIKNIEKIYKHVTKVKGTAVIDPHVITSLYLRKQLDKGPKGTKWKVISLVRDPITRNISGFFEAFDRYFPKVANEYNSNNIKMEDRIDELTNLFLENYNHTVPIVWFDLNLKPVFGIDVYEQEFPTSIGYKIYHGVHADLLLFRLENLNSCAHQAFTEFLGLDQFDLLSTNIAKNKPYYTAYQKFLNTIKLPDSYIDQMYTSKFAKHFYTEEEIVAFKSRWSK